MVHVYAARIPEAQDGCRKRTPAKAAYSHKEQSEWAYRLLEEALKREFPGLCMPVSVEKDTWGKPFLKDYPGISVSISHSGGFVACAIGEKPVGVDLEVWKNRKNGSRVVEKFHPEEQSMLGELEEEQRQRAFFELWVLKESFLKAEGRGLRIRLDSFCVKPGIEGKGQVEQSLNDRNYFFQLYQIPGELASLAVCSEEKELADEPIWLTLPAES